MGGSKTQVIQPTPPQPVSAGQSAKEFAQALPDIFQAQLEFQPQFNQLELEQFQELAPQFTEAARAISESLFPQVSALPEELAGLARQGITGDIPEDEKQLLLSDFNAAVGANALSPVAGRDFADLISRQRFARQTQFQNLGLSVAGFQPLQQPFTQQSPFSVANAFQPAFNTAQAGQNAFIQGSRPIVEQIQRPDILGGIGAGLTGLGKLGAGGGFGAIF